MIFVVKTDEEEAESTDLLIFILWCCLNRPWMGGGGVEQMSYFETAEIASFSS